MVISRILRTTRNLLLAALLTGLLSGCDMASLGGIKKDSAPETLNAAEVRKLLVGQTVESKNLDSGVVSFTFYAPDGSARQERLWTKRSGHWRITPEGEICMAMESRKESCRLVGKQKGKYRKYQVGEDGTLVPVIRYYRFLPGNPLKL